MKALKVVGTVVAVVGLAATGLGLALAPGAFAFGLGTAGLLTVGTFAALAAGVIGLASAVFAPKPKFGSNGQGGNPLQFQTNPQSGLPYAIGRCAMAGVRVHADTYDATGFKSEGKQDVVGFAVLLSAGGATQEIEKFTADGETVTFGGSGNAIGKFANYMAQKVSLGAVGASALALSFGGGNFPGWTADHKLSGITHALWDVRYDEKGEILPAGIPEPRWIGKWVKVYDPRKDSSYPGGSGSHRAGDESTYEWSNNPALHALTWAIGRFQNGKRTLGIGAPIEGIRVADFVEAANVADANDWTCGGVEWSTDSKWAIFKKMLQAGGAEPTMTGAMIGCRVNAPRVSIATIEANELLDSLSISATRSRRDRFNTVIPRYRSEEHDWEIISGSPISVPQYVTDDGGIRIKEIDFPLVQHETGGDGHLQAGELAAYEIVNSREGGPITFTTGPKFIGVKTGDVVTLNVPDEGLDMQDVLIRSVSRDPATMKLTFTAETETFEKHDFALGKTTIPPNTWSPTPPDLTPPTPSEALWSLTGGLTGEGLPCITISGACEFPGATAVLLRYRKVGATEWATLGKQEPAEPVNVVVAPLESETQYEAGIAYQSDERIGEYLTLGPVMTGAGSISANEFIAWLSNPSQNVPVDQDGNVLTLGQAGGKVWVSVGSYFPDADDGLTFDISDDPALTYGGTFEIDEEGIYHATALTADVAQATIIVSMPGRVPKPIPFTLLKQYPGADGVANWSRMDVHPAVASFDGAGEIVSPDREYIWYIKAQGNLEVSGSDAALYRINVDGSETLLLTLEIPEDYGAEHRVSGSGIYSNVYAQRGPNMDDDTQMGLMYMDGTQYAAIIGAGMGLRVRSTITLGGDDYEEVADIMKVQDGAAGQSNRELTIYRRATSAPSTPSGGSYNFGTGVLTPPSSWFTSIPSGNDPIYAASGVATIDGTTGTDVPTWLGVGLLAQEGSGVNVVFKRSVSQPSTPSASSGVPSTWYDEVNDVPAGAGIIWSSFGTRPNAGANWTWNVPVKTEGEDGTDGSDGEDGTDGDTSRELTVYKRATSAPSTPSGGSYNFGTGVLTPPSTWSTTIPAGNDPLYAATGVAAIIGTTGTDTPTWFGVGLIGQEGAGVNVIFRRSTTQPATPSASSGVPASWYDEVDEVPAGSGQIWTSFGTRPNAGANWTWQAPVRTEGVDGEDGTGGGNVGAFAFAASDDSTSGAVQAYYGSITVGAGNLTLSGPVYIESGVATGTVTYRVTKPGGTVVTLGTTSIGSGAGHEVTLSTSPVATGVTAGTYQSWTIEVTVNKNTGAAGQTVSADGNVYWKVE